MSDTVEKKITLVEFNADSVYVQYEDYDSNTLSYSKAKSVFKDLKYKISYSTCGSPKAMEFCNSISRRKYLMTENTIEPKPKVFEPIKKRRW